VTREAFTPPLFVFQQQDEHSADTSSATPSATASLELWGDTATNNPHSPIPAGHNDVDDDDNVRGGGGRGERLRERGRERERGGGEEEEAVEIHSVHCKRICACDLFAIFGRDRETKRLRH
jgi:hypothetical protein